MNALPFLSVAAEYHIPADANPNALFDDGQCFLSSAIGALEGMDQDKQPPIYWAALYLLRMAQAAYGASVDGSSAEVRHEDV